MEAYSSFAEVYDLFMDNVPYGQWCDYITELLRDYGIADGLVLDLGCGTGRLTRLLAAAGYDMIGVDNSPEMLEIARRADEADVGELEEPPLTGDESAEGQTLTDAESSEEPPLTGDESSGGQTLTDAESSEEPPLTGDESSEGQPPTDDVSEGQIPADDETAGARSETLYLLQDMRSFELYGTVRAVVSSCDALNYILEADELREIFALVNNYLDPGGIFVFDLNTVYKYREILGETTICENRDEGSFIWENYYDGESAVNEYDLTLYIRAEGDCYHRYEETHYQRGYELSEIKALLAEAGLTFVAAYDAFTREPVRADSERICIVARECGKATDSV